MKLNYSGVGYSKPFPHTIINNFIEQEIVKAINAEWPDCWEKEEGRFTRKWNTQALTPTARELIDSVDLNQISKIVGIPDLIADPDLFGAGLHCIPRGGFLNMHVDFNQHPNGWHRRVNLLLYLNDDWDDSWHGHLCLAENPRGQLSPIRPDAGRCVIFETNDKSWHGHPFKLECPKDRQRRSIALYFYTKEPPQDDPHSTIYIK